MRTAQEVFNFVVGKLREQGRPSLNKRGTACMYRGEDGAKCAAGHLIPDSLYDPGWECRPACNYYITAVVSVINEHSDLVLALQRAHDGAAGIFNFSGASSTNYLRDAILLVPTEASWLEKFEAVAEAVAKKFKLEYV